ncbi:hypothetical protein [Aneurinibacillus terranovensis]|uniref:hypothetical protein n=1 Tax=Aneurinibacillus terranovensis TaxID=278991 RepID=UPI00040DBA9A|nr:hypothetical protein [Aneurinibacillus terranovensis]
MDDKQLKSLAEQLNSPVMKQLQETMKIWAPFLERHHKDLTTQFKPLFQLAQTLMTMTPAPKAARKAPAPRQTAENQKPVKNTPETEIVSIRPFRSPQYASQEKVNELQRTNQKLMDELRKLRMEIEQLKRTKTTKP